MIVPLIPDFLTFFLSAAPTSVLMLNARARLKAITGIFLIDISLIRKVPVPVPLV
jgi:hypothetical protein